MFIEVRAAFQCCTWLKWSCFVSNLLFLWIHFLTIPSMTQLMVQFVKKSGNSESTVTSSQALFGTSLKNMKTFKCFQQYQQILIFEKLEPSNIWYFYVRNYFNDYQNTNQLSSDVTDDVLIISALLGFTVGFLHFIKSLYDLYLII